MNDSLHKRHKGTQEAQVTQETQEAQETYTDDTQGTQGAIEKAILDTLPKRAGKLDKQVFKLCRRLKGISGVSEWSDDDLRPVVEKWHALALAQGVAKAEPFIEAWIKFVRGWEQVATPALDLPSLLIIADKAPEAVYDVPGINRLLALCRELQKHHEEQPFFLSCRTAGKLLGVPHTQTNGWLFLLEYDGYLQVVKRGSSKTRRATEFFYTGRKKE